jgi:GNAT superfamily N-acetyltransferase
VEHLVGGAHAGSIGRLDIARARVLADAEGASVGYSLLRRRPPWRLVWVVIEQAKSDRAAVDLLADRMDLIEAVTDLRWLEWGCAPEPTDRDWWRAATVREVGRSQLPVTWVASDDSGALGAVGLGQFDIEERRDRSPWVLGMIVRRDCRGTGLGRLLLRHLERRACDQAHKQLWVATGGPAVNFYQRCGWQSQEIVHRDFEPATVLNKRLATTSADVQPASEPRPDHNSARVAGRDLVPMAARPTRSARATVQSGVPAQDRPATHRDRGSCVGT